MFAALLALALAIFAQAQATALRVGDEVVNGEGRQGRIEAIDGNFAKVRWGSGKYDFNMVPLSLLKSPKNAANETARKEQRRAFRDESRDYTTAVIFFYQFYNPKIVTGQTGGASAERIKEATADLAKLDQLCKSKYPGIENETGETDWGWRFGDWCDMAAKRQDLAQVAGGAAAKTIANFNSVERDLSDAFKDEEGFVSEDVQQLIYDRENWKRREAAAIAPKFKELGITIPADFFANVENQAEELKKIIDETAPKRNFDQPQFQDAASQAIAKSEFTRRYPGIQFLKIGASYAAWKITKNSIGIPTARYRTGWALVKMPNRPYCQARQWSVEQIYSGGGRFAASQQNLSSGQSGGIFVKCP